MLVALSAVFWRSAIWVLASFHITIAKLLFVKGSQGEDNQKDGQTLIADYDPWTIWHFSDLYLFQALNMTKWSFYLILDFYLTKIGLNLDDFVTLTMHFLSNKLILISWIWCIHSQERSCQFKTISAYLLFAKIRIHHQFCTKNTVSFIINLPN